MVLGIGRYILKKNTGLGDQHGIGHVNSDDLVHASQVNHDSTLDGHRTSDQTGSPASGNYGNLVAIGYSQDLGDILGAGRRNQNIGQVEDGFHLIVPVVRVDFAS